MWQSGQYRAPVIKPLPVKHPAIIDEFPPGRAELSLEAGGARKRDFERGAGPGVLESICRGESNLGDF